LQRLDIPAKDKELEKSLTPQEAVVLEPSVKQDDVISQSPLETDVFQYIKRRLAFLVKDDALFNEIDNIEYRKYKGKFVVYHKRERAGRLFDFYEGRSKRYAFDFGQGVDGEVATDILTDIDAILLDAFKKRVNVGDDGGKLSRATKASQPT
jgi:hypothetical protein